MDAMGKGMTIHVSPAGNDDWSGTSAEMNATRTDGPFATLERARAAARPYAGKTPVRVLVHAGVYPLTQPFLLTEEDGGTQEAPVVYAACRDERPLLDAGRFIAGWQRVTEDIPRLPAEAQGKLWKAEVPRHWRFSMLRWNDTLLPRSSTMRSDNIDDWITGTLGKTEHTLLIPETSVPTGEDLSSTILNCVPTPNTYWANALTDVLDFDRKTGTLRYAPLQIHRPDQVKRVPFRLENLRSGIARPGQWYVDAQNGTVWLWPLRNEDPNDARITASFLPVAIEVRGRAEAPVRFLTISGFSVTGADLVAEAAGMKTGSLGARGAAVALSHLEDCRIENLILRNNAGDGINASGWVRRVTVSQCLIEHMGGGGVQMRGSLLDPEATCANNAIGENHIHHCGLLYWHSSGIGLHRSEAVLIHNNLVHDMPYAGIINGSGVRHRWLAGWPRRYEELEDMWARRGEGEPTILKAKALIPGHNRIEKNIVFSAMGKLDDGAAIYCHAGHHSLLKNNLVWRGIRPKTFGLYFDDEEMSSTMDGNIVLDCPVQDRGHGSAIHVHNNPNNTLRGNLIIANRCIFSFPSSYGGHRLEHNLLLYRETAAILKDPSPVMGPGDGRRQKDWVWGPSTVEGNLYWSKAGKEGVAAHLNVLRAKGFEKEGRTRIGVPGLVITPERLLQAKSGTLAAEVGFAPIDLAGIGPRERFAASVPPELWEALRQALVDFSK